LLNFTANRLRPEVNIRAAHRFRSLALTAALVLCCLCDAAFSQLRTGVRWTEPNAIEQALDELRYFDLMNISYIEIEGQPSQALLNSLVNFDFEVVLFSEFRFLTARDLSQDTQLVRDIGAWVQIYSNAPAVDGFSLFSDSHTASEVFNSLASQLFDRLSAIADKSIGFHFTGDSAAAIADFRIYDIVAQNYVKLPSATVYYRDQTFDPGDAARINSILSLSPKLLIADAAWLAEAAAAQPQLATAYSLLPSEDIRLPESRPSPPAQPPNWPVLGLIFIWVSLALHYRYQPNYRNQLMRYFTANSFFLDDVLAYRIRGSAPPLVILLQHIIAAGLLFFVCSKAAFSPTGLEAFFHHYPGLSFTGVSYATFFMMGIGTAVLLHLTALLWLHLTNPELQHISQSLTIYAWPLHLNLLLITLVTALFVSGQTGFIFIVLTVLFVLIWFNAFNLAAWQSERVMSKHKALHFLGTVVLHVVSAGISIWLLLAFTDVVAVSKLASSL